MPITIGDSDSTHLTKQDSRAIKIIDGLSLDHPIHPTATESPPMSTMNANRTKLTRNKSDQRRGIHHASRHDGGGQ
jgi:hypothetical protein